AMLHAACAAPPSAPSGRSRNLRLLVTDRSNAVRMRGIALAVVVAVVDGQEPQVAETIRTDATVLGVSAGAATAEQLARVAANTDADGRQIAGILVADPDPADHSVGRLPQSARAAHRRMPRRITGTSVVTRP